MGVCVQKVLEESPAKQLRANCKSRMINYSHSKVTDTLTIFIISCWIPGR